MDEDLYLSRRSAVSAKHSVTEENSCYEDRRKSVFFALMLRTFLNLYQGQHCYLQIKFNIGCSDF